MGGQPRLVRYLVASKAARRLHDLHFDPAGEISSRSTANDACAALMASEYSCHEHFDRERPFAIRRDQGQNFESFIMPELVRDSPKKITR